MMKKTALVTGSSSGIGLQIAETLIASGYRVILTGRNVERLSEVARRLKTDYFAGDLSDFAFCEQLIASATAQFGVIDILVNNAGEYVFSPAVSMKPEDIRRLTAVNLEAPLYLIALIVAAMKRNGYGRIINIGSISGAVGEPNAAIYSATKAGLIGMTKALGLELAEFGITVNTINPGWVKTALTQTAIDNHEIDEKETLEQIPQHRFVEPREVAELVAYLVSDNAKGITGQSINLCAGLSIG